MTEAAPLETTLRPAGDELDVAELSRWMAEHVDGYRGPLTAERFKGGQSNPTYRLTAAERRYVLRGQPKGMLAKGAHDVLREARIITALEPTGVPVAKVVGTCSYPDVIGTDFYIMDHVDGRIFWDPTFACIPDDKRSTYFDAMNRTMAALHAVDPEKAGLSDFGRPGNYFERQISRWTRQYHSDVEAGHDQDMDWLVAQLPSAVPEASESRVIHGDFRCDNMIFHPKQAEVIAVLDWELSTLGDPLSDFAYHALMYRIPPSVASGFGDRDPRELGVPTEEEYLAAYCERTGRREVQGWEFYIAFNLFRLAAIMHGIKARAIRGTAASPEAYERARSLPALARLARQSLERI